MMTPGRSPAPPWWQSSAAAACAVQFTVAMFSSPATAQAECIERNELTSHCARWKGNTAPGAEPMRLRREKIGMQPLIEKVIGGNSTSIDENPWQVSLVVREIAARHQPLQGHFCGGSYIGDGWVITAAHCVDAAAQVGDMAVIGGTADLTVSPGDQGKGGLAEVERIVVHPGWSHDPQRDLRHDIALLRIRGGAAPPGAEPVRGPASLTKLPPSMKRAHNSRAKASGWGRTLRKPDDRVSPLLQAVDLPAVSSDLCGSPHVYGSYFHAEGMICYGPQDATRGTCSGDSGGPLTVERNGRRYLVGLTSFGRPGCTGEHAYSVFTRVEAYAPWVAEVTGLRSGWLEP